MKPAPTVSVIIPTYNRKDSLLRCLDSLSRQVYPMDRLSVIVVDDGSSDGTQTITRLPFPFLVTCLSQKNQGATAARNYGASISQDEILIFIDDDVTVSPETVRALAETCCGSSKAMAMGTIIKRNNTSGAVYTSIVLTMAAHTLAAHDDVEFHFVDCNSELLACRRRDFFEIGMFQDPTGGNGWPNWDDVDFGYRAHQNGFRLLGTSQAVADHWDNSISERALACRRFYRAGRSAVWLFKRYPGLKTHIPMLADKTPITWGHDSPRLMVRKLVRSLVSSQPVLGAMVLVASILERRYPSPVVLRRLYYLLHGANLLQGYRAGLREFDPVGA